MKSSYNIARANRLWLFIFVILIASCSSQGVLQCPQFKQKKSITERTVKLKKHKQKRLASNERKVQKRISAASKLAEKKSNSSAKRISKKAHSTLELLNKSIPELTQRLTHTLRPKQSARLVKSIAKKSKLASDECDELALYSGQKMDCVVVDVTDTEIQYRDCEDPEGPLQTIEKAKVRLIKYHTGAYQAIYTADGKIDRGEGSIEYTGDRKLNAMALIGFILTLLGIFTFGIGSLVGFIVCWIGLNQINKNPEKYSGKGFAIAGLILSGLMLLLTVIVLILLVAILSGA